MKVRGKSSSLLSKIVTLTDITYSGCAVFRRESPNAYVMSGDANGDCVLAYRVTVQDAEPDPTFTYCCYVCFRDVTVSTEGEVSFAPDNYETPAPDRGLGDKVQHNGTACYGLASALDAPDALGARFGRSCVLTDNDLRW